MNKYSSTILKMFNSNCPAALGHYENQTPADNDFFNTGIAAHAVLQVIGEKEARTEAAQLKVAHAVVDELITKGRSYNGRHEPPMAPSHAQEGRDIALEWLQWNELPDHACYEIGLGMSAAGVPCEYDAENCRFRAITDLIYFETVGDEDFNVDAVCVRDYKSAWPTNESELDTLQRKGQAVMAHLHYPDYAAIKLEVINLRTGQSFEKVIMMDDAGRELIKLWERDILQACKAADATRESRPGAGCLSCLYTLSCDDCMSCANGNGGDLATQLAALEAVRADLIKTLKPKAVDNKFPVEQGYVGYRTQTKKITTPDAPQLLMDNWFADDADHAETRSLLKAMKFPASAVENAAKLMYPDKNDAAREDLLDAAITTKAESRFGVFKI